MKKIIALFFVLIISFSSKAVNDNIRRLTNNDGLSNSSINAISQDSIGQMWFGTWDGLNIYNGKEFEVFKPESDNSQSISNNIIRDIVEEKEGIEWIATDLGINRFDTRTKKCQRYFFGTKNWNITDEHSFLIAKNNANKIFASVYQQGIFFFDEDNGQFVKLNIQNGNNVKKIFFDSENHLWLYSDKQRLTKIIFDEDNFNNPLIDSNINIQMNIESLFYDSQNQKIWTQTSDKKYGFYAIAENKFHVCSNDFSSVGTIKAVVFKKDYHLLGTEKGLYKYDLKTNVLTQVISKIAVLSLYAGTQNIIWIGTDMQGIWQMLPSQEKFQTYPVEDFNLFNHSAVRTFIEEEQGNLWIGTKGSGIYLFSKDKNTNKLIKQTHFGIENGLLSNSVFTIVHGLNNEIWIGTDGRGINYFDAKSRKIYSLNIKSLQQSNINLSSIYSIFPGKDDVLWVGTSGFGMYKLEINRKTTPYSVKSYKQYIYRENQPSLSNNIVYSIIKDDDTHLWIATRGGGINRFNIETEQFNVIHFGESNTQMTSNDDILCLYKDSKGFLWAGTSMGLNKLIDYKGEKPVFEHFSEKEGMPNNTIHGILEDKQKNIWLSTNKGIAKLIQDADKYRIISYYKKDGLQNNEFSDGAFYQSPYSKQFYFGGIDGFNVFNPMDITYDSYMPSLIMNAFYVDNEQTNLINHLVERKNTQTLELSYKNKSFSFRFVPIDYISGNKCEIAYYLEGYQKDWIQLGTSNTLVFSNIPSGDYTLKVRCSNADKLWSEGNYVLPIKILSPWYANGYAYAVYALLLLLTTLGIWRFLRYQISVKKKIRQKEMEKQKMEEIHQEKLRFFTNIAHEFSNSLTLIYGPSEQLLRKGNEDPFTKKYLNIIKSNSERMQTLIQQLIDFRKAEKGHLNLNIQPIDVVELIKFEADHFLIMFEQKHIHFKMDFLPEKIVWNTDGNSLEKIIFNLLSNAVKYTPQNESIEVSTQADDDFLTVKVTNTGIGIKKEYQQSIFDRFEVLNQFEKEVSKGLKISNGIGLSLCKSLTELLHGKISLESDEKTYTSFIVRLPERPVSSEGAPNVENIANDKKQIEQYNTESYSASSELLPENKNKGLVLVIDDDEEICQFIYDILNNKFKIEKASNGQEAIEMIKTHTPTIIICDVIMPVMDGIEFVKIMKQQELTRHIPIILLSSKSSIEHQIEGLETGADAYLGKPFHPRHMEALIESLLHRDKAVLDYSKSPYSAVERFEGQLIKKEDKALITTITEIIYNNIDNDSLSIDLIARETALSKMQLYRKIKELLDMTPTEYIRSIRLKQSEKLLKTTNKTVQEIMYSCGFNNKAYFYREFSKKYHLTPKEYRNKQEL